MLPMVILGMACGKETSAPGAWQIYPRRLIQATETPLEVRYEHKGKALEPGEGFMLTLEKISISTLFHCPMSEEVKLIPYKGELPKIEMKLEPIHGVGYREIFITFPDGLKKGESFALKHGNLKPDGDIVALVTVFPMKNLGLPVYSLGTDGERTDWFDAGWYGSIPKCDIVAGDASALRLFVPSIVKTGEPFALKISITDGYDSRPDRLWAGELQIESNEDVADLPQSVTIKKADKCFKMVENLTVAKEGVYRIRVKTAGGEWFESNPVVVRNEVDNRIYWGNIHNHGQYSECFGESNEWFYETARMVSGMDYVALSDHIYTIPDDQETGRLYKWHYGHKINFYDAWKNTIEVANRYNAPGYFVTLVGYENGAHDAGHYNVYMENPTMEKMDKMFPKFGTGYVQTIRDAVKDNNVLFFPHCHAANFSWTLIEEQHINGEGKRLTPVIEIYSDWGSIFLPYDREKVDSKFGGPRSPSTRSALWAWKKGFKFGAVADADAHTGLPGRRVVGSPAQVHDHPAGITAAMTHDFTRRGIMDCYHDMSTYGTTGEHIFLDIRLSGVSMGKELRTDDEIDTFVQIAGTGQLSTFHLYQGETLLKSVNLNTKDTVLNFTLPAPDFEDERAYVVEVVQEDEEMAWSSPVWVSKYSQPDLTWEKNEGKLYLVNKGSVAAKHVVVGYSPDEHPFTLPGIGGDPPTLEQDGGYIWSERRDDNKVIFHYRWQGEPLKGKMKYGGLTMDPEDDMVYNAAFYASRSKNKITGNEFDFQLLPFHVPGYIPGYDIIFEVKHNEPAYVEFEFEHAVETQINNERITAKVLRIPLNGRVTSKPLKQITVPVLAPGAKYEVGDEKGYWAADPENTTGESNKSNNLFKM